MRAQAICHRTAPGQIATPATAALAQAAAKLAAVSDINVLSTAKIKQELAALSVGLPILWRTTKETSLFFWHKSML
jgi:hypothetical protein